MAEGAMKFDGVQWRIPEWFQDVTSDAQQKLKIFHEELISFNGRMNLISPTTEKKADLVHFADSILGSRLIVEKTQNKKIFDLGSGNGLPGLVMATIFPDIEVVPVEADARKYEFIKHCAGRMKLSNLNPILSRVEDLAEGSISCAVTRAMASISKSLLFTRKCAASGCEFFHFKGSTWASEIAEIPSQVLAHWSPEHTGDYVLPNRETKMTIVCTRRS